MHHMQCRLSTAAQRGKIPHAARYAHADAGVGLVAVLVGIALLGIMTPTIAGAIANLRHAGQSMEIRNSLEDVRLLVRANIACHESFATQPAACGQTQDFVEVKRYRRLGDGGNANPKPLVRLASESASFTRIGNQFVLRARCVACVAADRCPGAYKLRIEVNRLNKLETKPLVDPLTRKMLDGHAGTQTNGIAQGWADLFKGSPPLCVMP